MTTQVVKPIASAITWICVQANCDGTHHYFVNLTK